MYILHVPAPKLRLKFMLRFTNMVSLMLQQEASCRTTLYYLSLQPPDYVSPLTGNTISCFRELHNTLISSRAALANCYILRHSVKVGRYLGCPADNSLRRQSWSTSQAWMSMKLSNL